MQEPEQPTSEGARRAGYRYSHTCPGSILVLRHSGMKIGLWKLEVACDQSGFAVEQFKLRRGVMKFGALAIWSDGVVTRFEQFKVESLIGKYGTPHR